MCQGSTCLQQSHLWLETKFDSVGWRMLLDAAPLLIISILVKRMKERRRRRRGKKLRSEHKITGIKANGVSTSNWIDTQFKVGMPLKSVCPQVTISAGEETVGSFQNASNDSESTHPFALGGQVQLRALCRGVGDGWPTTVINLSFRFALCN
ncbi:hypothetical protein CEXT_531371 [Caerostris extrusa]|uniref:Uncharacterized protein n=1 Tax=Caerostris extrusa TaxID=172846 RepID=A0AAV4Y4C1_CAEEX|nr:hypothetical protein CEXT_531371 [Caerostris extrusa]